MAVLFAFAAGVACLCFTVLLPSSNVAWMCLVDEKHDDQAYVAAKVLSGRLRQADIVVFGTSSTREALWHEDALQTAIEPVGGRAKEIVILASSEQSPIEALFLATLGETRSGQLFVVFLGFGALHFNSPFEKLENGAFLVSPEHLVAAFSQDNLYPRHWASWTSHLSMRWHALRQKLQRQIKFGLRSWVRKTIYGIPVQPYQIYRYADVKQVYLGGKAEFVEQRKRDFAKNFESNLAYALQTLDLLAITMKQNGSRMVIAAPPEFGPELRQSHPAEYARFEAGIRSVAQRNGIDVIDWNPRIGWTAADAIDSTHASPAGRDKWSAAFVDWVQRQRR